MQGVEMQWVHDPDYKPHCPKCGNTKSWHKALGTENRVCLAVGRTINDICGQNSGQSAPGSRDLPFTPGRRAFESLRGQPIVQQPKQPQRPLHMEFEIFKLLLAVYVKDWGQYDVTTPCPVLDVAAIRDSAREAIKVFTDG